MLGMSPPLPRHDARSGLAMRGGRDEAASPGATLGSAADPATLLDDAGIIWARLTDRA
jgi:hypothetical protein